MTNLKTTKRALLSSVIALLVCFTMLLGTTFAWFTDEAKSAGNIIQTGDLEISLEKKQATDNTWVNAEGETINFTAADGRAQDQILWEPGCTYVMEYIRVTNTGNLALKYEIHLADITGDKELLDVIDFTYALYDTTNTNQVAESGSFGTIKGHLLPGETSGTIIIAAHMDEDAGNEYENKKLENISVMVTAQQYAYEKDSYGDSYDALIEDVESVLISDNLKSLGYGTYLSANLHGLRGITDVNSFYVNILDQNGEIITKITPTQNAIGLFVDSKKDSISATAYIDQTDVDNDGYWNRTVFVPTMGKVPTKAVLYVNGVEKGSSTSFVYGGSFSSWADVVAAYANENDADNTKLNSGRIVFTGERYQIAADIVPSVTVTNDFYANIYDQNGNLLTVVTPASTKVGASVGTICAAITGDSSSWDNTAYVPTLSAVPTVMELYIDGELYDVSYIENNATHPNYGYCDWSTVVAAYNAANP